jgi:hypothetical protein
MRADSLRLVIAEGLARESLIIRGEDFSEGKNVGIMEERCFAADQAVDS